MLVFRWVDSLLRRWELSFSLDERGVRVVRVVVRIDWRFVCVVVRGVGWFGFEYGYGCEYGCEMVQLLV
jgi:hypothetical protein